MRGRGCVYIKATLTGVWVVLRLGRTLRLGRENCADNEPLKGFRQDEDVMRFGFQEGNGQ